jgi:hypothetical protein
MDTLILALADLEAPGETVVSPDPGACPICNDCKGWESERSTPNGTQFVIKEWPKAGFQIKTSFGALAHSGEGGCPTCGIFRGAAVYFQPELEDDAEVQGWLPVAMGSLPVVEVTQKNTGGEMKLEFQCFTREGEITCSPCPQPPADLC